MCKRGVLLVNYARGECLNKQVPCAHLIDMSCLCSVQPSCCQYACSNAAYPEDRLRCTGHPGRPTKRSLGRPVRGCPLGRARDSRR